jgi:serine phosphatase RsbU (regulator of sigma subunit)
MAVRAGTTIDVAGSVRRSAAMQGSIDAELRALYAALPVGVGFLTPDLRYQRVNETLARMNGRSVEEHLGAPIEAILGERAAPVRGLIESVIERREAVAVEGDIAVPGDPIAWRTVEATYFPVFAPDGTLLGVGGVVNDVTARRMLEREQTRLLEEAVRGRERIEFLAEAGARMAESVEWEPTLRAVVRSAVPGVADWCSLTVVEPNGRLRVAAVSEPDRERPADTTAATAEAIRTGEMHVAGDTLAIVPLKAPDGVIGALTFLLGESGRRFTPEDLTLIRSLGARAQLHVQNARLYSERSHIATTLQAGLRPGALPAIPGVELAARFRPAGDESGVGGDFLDVFPSGEDAWAVIVGDVAGKGPEAALVTAVARHTLRAVSMLDDRPAANLGLLNRALRVDGAPGHYCTVFYARVCPGEHGLAMRYGNAGHPSPFVLRADGRVEEVAGGRGPLAGATRAAAVEESEDRLGAGDLLLLYTDGVTEVRTDDLNRGERELRALLASMAGASAADVVAAVERRALELRGPARRDDIALVAIRVA